MRRAWASLRCQRGLARARVEARCWGAVLLFCCCLAGPARAQATPPQSSAGFNWVRLEGAESCISAAQLVERVEHRVNRVLFTSTAEAELFIDGRVQPADLNAWLVTIEMSDRTGRVLGARSLLFRGEECSVIDETVALFIAVRLYSGTGFDDPLPLTFDGDWPIDDDPDPVPSTLPPVPPAEGSGSLGDSPAPALTAPQELAEPPLDGIPILDLSAVAGLGQVPGAGAGISAHVTLNTGLGWPLDLGFTALFERVQQAEHIPGQAGFALQVGSAQLCPVRPARWLALCGGAELGRLGVTPAGFREGPGALSQVVVGALASSVLRIRLPGPLSLHARLTLTAPLVRPPYQYETPSGNQQLFRMSWLAGRGEVGLGFDL